MASGRIQQRIDPNLQRQVEVILKALGIKPAQAIAMFYREILRQRNLPFHPTEVHPSEIPNKQLQKDIIEAEQGIGIQKFDSVEDAFTALDAL